MYFSRYMHTQIEEIYYVGIIQLLCNLPRLLIDRTDLLKYNTLI